MAHGLRAIHTETYNYNYNGGKKSLSSFTVNADKSYLYRKLPTVSLENDLFSVIVIGLSVNGPLFGCPLVQVPTGP